jgi:menaquinone-dependent protoporphyrinogen oxidase
MNRILILYSSSEGHTERIAQHLLTGARAHNFAADALDAAHPPDGFSFDAYSAAIVAAPVHRRRQDRETVEFVRRNIRDLERMPTAFVSVPLTKAGADDAAAARVLLEAFLSNTGWRPTIARSVAGVLVDSPSDWFLPWVRKTIAHNAGASLNWDYTNWGALDQVIEELCALIPTKRSAAGCRPASSESVLR